MLFRFSKLTDCDVADEHLGKQLPALVTFGYAAECSLDISFYVGTSSREGLKRRDVKCAVLQSNISNLPTRALDVAISALGKLETGFPMLLCIWLFCG
jgi:hypothetical protein